MEGNQPYKAKAARRTALVAAEGCAVYFVCFVYFVVRTILLLHGSVSRRSGPNLSPYIREKS
jgi:hypothetical protein